MRIVTRTSGVIRAMTPQRGYKNVKVNSLISATEELKRQWRAEGLVCPGPTRSLDAHQLKKFSPYQFMSKISDDHFLVISQNFTKIFPVIFANYLPKILTTFLVISPNFRFFFLNIFPDAPFILDAQGRSHFLHMYTLTFSTFTYAFFLKTPPLDTPSVMPGPSHPPHPPLHATVKR